MLGSAPAVLEARQRRAQARAASQQRVIQERARASTAGKEHAHFCQERACASSADGGPPPSAAASVTSESLVSEPAADLRGGGPGAGFDEGAKDGSEGTLGSALLSLSFRPLIPVGWREKRGRKEGRGETGDKEERAAAGRGGREGEGEFRVTRVGGRAEGGKREGGREEGEEGGREEGGREVGR